MTVSESAVYGMYPRNIGLPEVVHTLNRAGFESEDICMVLSPTHPAATAVRDARIVNANMEETAASARMIGWFSEFGAVVIPTVGFFIRSQAFFHALMIEQNFSLLFGGSKTLAGLGFSGEDAARLGAQLCDVGVLVYVACSKPTRADCAIDLLWITGAGEATNVAQGTESRRQTPPRELSRLDQRPASAASDSLPGIQMDALVVSG